MKRILWFTATLLIISFFSSEAVENYSSDSFRVGNKEFRDAPSKDLQGVARNFVVLEIGTGAWCVYCPGASMGAHDLIEQGYDVAVIKYHSGDPFDNTHAAGRIYYYDIESFPTAIFDGIDVKTTGNANTSLFPTYLQSYENRIGVDSYFTLDATVVNTSDNHWTVTVDAEMIIPVDNKTLALHVAVTESNIAYNWQNQTEISNALRLMVPNHLGTTLNFEDNPTHHVALNFDLNKAYQAENCELIVFLQDRTTKEIHQAAKAVMEPITGVETHDQMAATIYPNPASGYVNVVTANQNAVLKVMDTQGRVVMIQELIEHNQRIDISQFNSGLYLFIVATEFCTYTQKVIVQ